MYFQDKPADFWTQLTASADAYYWTDMASKGWQVLRRWTSNLFKPMVYVNGRTQDAGQTIRFSVNRGELKNVYALVELAAQNDQKLKTSHDFAELSRDLSKNTAIIASVSELLYKTDSDWLFIQRGKTANGMHTLLIRPDYRKLFNAVRENPQFNVQRTKVTLGAGPGNTYVLYVSEALSPAFKPSKNIPVTGAPSLKPAQIKAILKEYGSAAATEKDAACFYQKSLKYGIDVAFFMAIFGHESGFGTALPKSLQGNSIGNMKVTTLGAKTFCDRPAYKDFCSYSSWCQSAEHWYYYIKNGYVNYKGEHRTTAERIIPVYCPVTDKCNVNAYIDYVNKCVNAWRSGSVRCAA